MTRVLIAVVLAIAGIVGWELHRRGRQAMSIPSLTVTKTHFARHVTADGNLRAVVATPISVPQIEGMWGAMTIASLTPDGSTVKRGEVIARFDRIAAEKQLRDAELDLEAATARLREEQLRAAANDADHAAAAALAARQATRAQRFQSKDELLFSRNQIIESDLDVGLATARKDEAERARKLDRKVSSAAIELAEINRQRSVLAVGHARKALANLELRAPTDGLLVLHRDDHGDIPKPGARLYPEQPIAELPVLDAMEAELFVLEVDGSGLEVGQPADVVVSSRPEVVFHGVVRLVDKLAKPRDPGVPVQYFSVVIALDRTDRAAMKPGQRVRATLVTDAADAIVVPRQAVSEQDGVTIVYRRGDHGFAPVPVTLGAATPGRVAITSGLEPGDVIALRDPTPARPRATP